MICVEEKQRRHSISGHFAVKYQSAHPNRRLAAECGSGGGIEVAAVVSFARLARLVVSNDGGECAVACKVVTRVTGARLSLRQHDCRQPCRGSYGLCTHFTRPVFILLTFLSSNLWHSQTKIRNCLKNRFRFQSVLIAINPLAFMGSTLDAIHCMLFGVNINLLKSLHKQSKLKTKQKIYSHLCKIITMNKEIFVQLSFIT